MLTVQNVSHDPFYNQAFEEYIYQTYLDDDIFLLWQNAPAVVVGSYQNICREVHVEALRQRGIPVVRRISGGGTVYHDLGNVNYTYIVRAGTLNYDAVLSPVIAALNAIGVPARKNRTCDIAIGDLKISGSAQRMTKGRLLHHGTLLFSSDLGVLDQITTHRKNDCFQSRSTQSAICSVTNIREHLASPMTIEEFQNRLLEQMVPPGSPHLTLTAEQEAEVCRLRDEKYRSWEWTWGKTPAFTYEKSGQFHGALAAQLLNGARLDPEGFVAICRHLAGDRAEELMDYLM